MRASLVDISKISEASGGEKIENLLDFKSQNLRKHNHKAKAKGDHGQC